MEFFHLRESELIDVMNELDLTKSEWNAAFRAILRQPLSYFLEHRKEIFTKFDNKYGVELEKGETYMSDDYKAMVNLVSRVPISHCGKTRNSLSPNFFSSNQLFRNLFSKNVTFTEFLPKMREREFP